ncbi:MAG TPA: glycosyl hydrolase family 28-related protein [Rariglobus sp.]|jgi:hypothetical protein
MSYTAAVGSFGRFPFVLLLAISASVAAGPTGPWRSALFPEDWTPGYKDAEGRFLHDFSYAGYHSGEKPLPAVEAAVIDAVAAFGADPSGAKDSAQAIQSAIDAAQAGGGGVVYLPAGTYLCSKGLLIKRDRIVLRGAGPSLTQLVFSGREKRDDAGITIQGNPSLLNETALVNDAPQLTRTLDVADASRFKVGDDVDVSWMITAGFVAEHGMTGTWSAHNGTRQVFFRVNITAINTTGTPHRIVVDAPLRYPAKIRDAVMLSRRNSYVEECGIERLSLSDAMPVNNEGLWPAGKRRRLVTLSHAKNCWIRDVHSFAPEGTGGHQLYDKGFQVLRSKRITIEDCSLAHAQRREGGCGYLYELSGSNDILLKNCSGVAGRHNFTSNWLFGNVGNVFLRCLSRDGALGDWKNAPGPSDFHHSLSIACLIDSSMVDDGWDAANRGKTSAGAGHTVTQSVFWNCRGAGNIRSAQYGLGYLIGLAATLNVVTEVNLNEPLQWWEKQYVGTEPWDFVEGPGRNESLQPQSLYEEQLRMRLLKTPSMHEPRPRAD